MYEVKREKEREREIEKRERENVCVCVCEKRERKGKWQSTRFVSENPPLTATVSVPPLLSYV